jgi:putative lipoprotein
MRNILFALSFAIALPAQALAQPELIGVTFQVESIAGARVVAKTATFQAMPDGRVAGSGGCNRYGGAGALADGKATFGAIVSTRMACAPELMAQEQALFGALQKAARYEAKAGSLTLLDATGAALVHLRRR